MTTLLQRGAVLAVVAGAGAFAVLSCTVFNDVPLPRSADAGDAATESGRADAGRDGGDPRSAGLLSLPDAVRVCSVASACLAVDNLLEERFRLPIFAGYSYCVTNLNTTLEPSRPGRALVTAALQRIASLGPSGSCSEAQREFDVDPRGFGDSAYPASLCSGPDGLRCLDSKTLLDCDHNDDANPVYITHCERPSNAPSDTCLSYDGGAWCGSSLDCGNDDATCFGDILRRCYGRVDAEGVFLGSFDCSAIGMRCVADSLTVGCSVDATIRKDDGSVRAYCDGTRYVTSAGSYFSAIDCASFGGRCVPGNLVPEPHCVFDTDECSPFDTDVDRCSNATTVSLCVGGKRIAFDCASIGAVCAQEAGVAATCRIP